jgi:energy-coupling factor transport system ATP-binding protein
MTDYEIFSLSDMYFSYKKGADVLNIPVLQLPRYGVIALIGHNGAGKSTLARCLCGLEKKCGGIVTIGGKRYNRKQRLHYCYMVMQDVNHQLFTESVDEELLLSMVNPDKMQIDDTLKQLDLASFAERHPMSLSGGQKQRVAIASALVSNREILVFDEPTSGLDLLHMNEVAKSLERLRGIGKTSIVITHDYELIVSCSCVYSGAGTVCA